MLTPWILQLTPWILQMTTTSGDIESSYHFTRDEACQACVEILVAGEANYTRAEIYVFRNGSVEFELLYWEQAPASA